MIQVENLSYGFPEKDLYNEISFNIESGSHCVLIGRNGCGKSTLVDMLINTEVYLYDGKIIKDDSCRIGYASQFSIRDKLQDKTVFEFLSQRFEDVQNQIAETCEKMATAESECMNDIFEEYQQLLDLNEAMDGDNFESNIHKQLNTAGLAHIESIMLSQLSGGEYKLVQIMREMLTAPNVLILDEPDVFLDFANINSLTNLINSYKGTLIVVTHNRFLLNHCFDKILHLENCDLQEFSGNYSQYRVAQFREKLKLKLQYIEEEEEIERTEVMVDILRKRASKMVNPVIGRSVNAKQSQLDRLLARHIKNPFIEPDEPEITLPQLDVEGKPDSNSEAAREINEIVLSVNDYGLSFEESILENVSFEIKFGEKVAIVGANGTGKTSLIKDILKNSHPAIAIAKDVEYATISQLHEGNDCCNDDKSANKCKLSGGEQNLNQIKSLADTKAELLILDEPTSHLDIYAQTAFERALAEYRGTVLMVSHDFYLVANCVDYVYMIEDNTIRRMRTRKFRKMVYERYFNHAYLEEDRDRQQLETEIVRAFNKDDLELADRFINRLELLNFQEK